MFADALMTALETARGGRALDDVSRAVWRGLAEGVLTDDDAQRLAEAIHARREPPARAVAGLGSPPAGARPVYPPRRPQRPPERSRAIERRRRLAASGPLPPALASRFTTSELAALRIVGDEVRARGVCMLPLAAIAARAGISRTSAQNALRRARALGLVTIEERRRRGLPSLTNVVRIVSPEWRAWQARGPRGDAPARSGEGGGFKKLTPTGIQSFEKREEGFGSGSRGHRPPGRGTSGGERRGMR